MRVVYAGLILLVALAVVAGLNGERSGALTLAAAAVACGYVLPALDAAATRQKR